MNPALVPEWFDRSALRTPVPRGRLDKLMRIDGIAASSWITRREKLDRPVVRQWRMGHPIRDRQLWRPLDVLAAARADSAVVAPTESVALQQTIEELKTYIAGLAQQRDALQVEVRRVECAHTVQSLAVLLERSARRLASREEILAAAGPVVDPCGVYFLVQAGEVAYVGQSVNVFSRVRQHSKEFDSIAWVSVPREYLDVVESLYIHALSPRLNCVVPLSIEELFQAARFPVKSKTRESV